ncbi:MAG: hypothetical protein ACD_73C00701G0002 [uncultured bacterium]|nr:MAG: hypothetical protein ACD_73C00701G0002 [uncultured bacterium]
MSTLKGIYFYDISPREIFVMTQMIDIYPFVVKFRGLWLKEITTKF